MINIFHLYCNFTMPLFLSFFLFIFWPVSPLKMYIVILNCSLKSIVLKTGPGRLVRFRTGHSPNSIPIKKKT